MAMQQYGYDDRDNRRHHDNRQQMQRYNEDPFNMGGMMNEFNRDFRHMNHEMHRMERALSRGDGNVLGSMVDKQQILPQFSKNDQGNQVARYHFDVNGFQPSDVSIKTSEGKIIVTARHEDKSEDHHAVREFRRMVAIPEGMDTEGMKSRLTPNGVLTIEAPFNPPALQYDSHREIPIQHESSTTTNKNTKAVTNK